MTRRAQGWLWAPRILAIGFCVFLAMFALDAFDAGKPFGDALRDFAVHLVPALLLLAIVGIAWRWEWVGAVAFIGLGAWYAYGARRHLDWVLVISGPMFAVGLLFLASWRQQCTLERRR